MTESEPAAIRRARATGKAREGESDIGDRNLGIRGCFIVSWEQMGTSKPAAVRRARATGKGREGEI